MQNQNRFFFFFFGVDKNQYSNIKLKDEEEQMIAYIVVF